MSLFDAIATLIGVALGIPIALGIVFRKDDRQ